MQPFSLRLLTKNIAGDEVWIQCSGQPVTMNSGGVCWHCLVLDVTREVEAEIEAEHQLALAAAVQRQESVGQLSGGVAHDFNNLLAVVMGSLELLLDQPQNEESRKLIQNALGATQRGAELTRSMLAFAKQAVLAPKPLNLNDVVGQAQSWIGRTLPKNINVAISLSDDVWTVEADESSTVSAFLNLIVNARDAMPDGGKLTVETENVEINAPYTDAHHQLISQGSYVMLAVSDTGTGIPPDVLDHIFEPFYTTKEPGSGTGLGLPMVQGFMRQSGGYVKVNSEVGVGTTVKLFFKASVEQHVIPPNSETTHQVTQAARILVVEDNPDVLASTCANLGNVGYQIRSVRNGDAALKLYEQDPNFDLVITDIVMPGELQGTTLSNALRQITPDLPIVFMSGYAREASVHGNGLRHSDIRLMKPIQRTDLINAIEKALGTGLTLTK